MDILPQAWIDCAALSTFEERKARFKTLADEGDQLPNYTADPLYVQAAQAQAQCLREMGLEVYV